MTCPVVLGLWYKIACINNVSGLRFGYAALKFQQVRRQSRMPGHGRFDLNGDKLALLLKNQIDLVPVTVLPKIQARLPAGIVQRQVKLQLKYKDLELDDDFTLDLIADGKVIVELKVVKELAPIHQAQLMTYMKLTDCKIGLLINFNVVHRKEGIRRLTLPN